MLAHNIDHSCYNEHHCVQLLPHAHTQIMASLVPLCQTEGVLVSASKPDSFPFDML
jgi:hypothetical protein